MAATDNATAIEKTLAKNADTDNDDDDVVYFPGRCFEIAGQLSVSKRKGSKIVWRGPIAELELALDAGIDALGSLYDEVNAEVAESPATISAGEEMYAVTVTRTSGEVLSFALGPEQTISDLKRRVASELRLWPCEVVLMRDEVIMRDHEVLSSVANSFSLVSRSIVAEAKAIVEDLACSIRLMKKKAEGVPKVAAAKRLFKFAAGPLLKAVLVDHDFGMWAARILDGLDFEYLSGLGFYRLKTKDNTSPPLLLLGHALAASDGGVAAAGVFVSLCDGERWCAHTVGQALQGTKNPGIAHGEAGEGSALACAFREAIKQGSETVARDLLAACVGIANVDSNCAAPVVLAGMVPAAAFAWKQRVEPEVQTLAAALITSLLDSLWPGRGCELKGNKRATKILVEAMVESALAEPSVRDDGATLLPDVLGALTKGAIFESLGRDPRNCYLQDFFIDYEHKPGLPNRPLAWLE